MDTLLACLPPSATLEPQAMFVSVSLDSQVRLMKWVLTRGFNDSGGYN